MAGACPAEGSQEPAATRDMRETLRIKPQRLPFCMVRERIQHRPGRGGRQGKRAGEKSVSDDTANRMTRSR